MKAEFHCITVVVLVSGHELDTAVEVPAVVPLHKPPHPLADVFHTGEWATWVTRLVLPAPRDFVYAVWNNDSE